MSDGDIIEYSVTLHGLTWHPGGRYYTAVSDEFPDRQFLLLPEDTEAPQ